MRIGGTKEHKKTMSYLCALYTFGFNYRTNSTQVKNNLRMFTERKKYNLREIYETNEISRETCNGWCIIWYLQVC